MLMGARTFDCFDSAEAIIKKKKKTAGSTGFTIDLRLAIRRYLQSNSVCYIISVVAEIQLWIKWLFCILVCIQT